MSSYLKKKERIGQDLGISNYDAEPFIFKYKNIPSSFWQTNKTMETVLKETTSRKGRMTYGQSRWLEYEF